MTREAILKFVREYFVRENDTPSIRTISESVPGVDRASFYQHFKDKSELLVALGIEVEESDLPQVAAMEAKKKEAKKEGSALVTLNRTQEEKVIAIAYMEGKTTSMVIDEMLEDQRQVREILLEVNEGILDNETIDAILNPDLVYKGMNVSKFAGKPWINLHCKNCGIDIIVGEDLNIKWLLEFLPIIKRELPLICEDCQPKPVKYTRIYTR